MVVKSKHYVLGRRIPGVGKGEVEGIPLDVAFHANPVLLQLLGTDLDHYRESKREAEEFLSLYWNPDDKGMTHIDLPEMATWLQNRKRIDAWFLILLIEAAGDAALSYGYSRHKSKVAAAKNNAPRTWVVEQWRERRDTQQSKASFARQYAPLVKKRFDVDVTPEQISRVWIPKT